MVAASANDGPGPTRIDPAGLLLERSGELSACRRALDEAVAGRGSFAVIEGPAGIGKTQLMRALRHESRNRGLRALHATGVEVEGEVAFGAVRQLLDPYLAELSTDEAASLFTGAAAPAKRVFGLDEGASGTGADSAFATLNGLYWLIATAAENRSLMIEVDDAHWVDMPSLRLLDFLATRIEELPVLIVFGTRPIQDDPRGELIGRIAANPGAQLIPLGPLSYSAIEALIKRHLGSDGEPVFIAACAEVTAGNPFYLIELLRELARRGAQPVSGAVDTVRSIGPRTIAHLLRFRGMDPDHGVSVARALAVLGDGARLEDVSALASVDPAVGRKTADVLALDGILAPGPTLSFAHPIVRSAVYADIPPYERDIAHAGAALILRESGAAPERIAAHLMNTGPTGEEWVVSVLRTSATPSFEGGAPEIAARYLRRALDENPHGDQVPEVLLELGKAEAHANFKDALEHLLEAYRLARDPLMRARVAVAIQPMLVGAGRIVESIDLLSRSREELVEADPEIALDLAGRLVAIAMTDPEVGSDQLKLLDVPDENLDETPAGRRLLCHIGYRLTQLSMESARAAGLVQRAVGDARLYAEVGTEGTEVSSAALTLIAADSTDAAARFLDDALTNASAVGSRWGFAHVSFLRSRLAYRRGDLRDAEAEVRASLALFMPLEQLLATAVTTSTLVSLLIEFGELDEAERALASIGVLDEDPPAYLPFNDVLSTRGQLRVAQGDLAGGLVDLYECGRRNERLGVRNPVFIPWRGPAAIAHHARGMHAEAWALADEDLNAAVDWGTPGAIGGAKRVRGLVSGRDDAIDLCREAADLLEQSPARLEHARALVDLGAALRRANHRRDARDPLRAGLDLADHCGATTLALKAADEMRAIGDRPRRRRLTGVEALTPSERRVAQLAAKGMSNVEIAQTLFVTRKTVEKHLGNAYAKLGVSARSELAAFLTRPNRA